MRIRLTLISGTCFPSKVHSSLSSAEVKNEGIYIYISDPLVSRHSVKR